MIYCCCCTIIVGEWLRSVIIWHHHTLLRSMGWREAPINYTRYAGIGNHSRRYSSSALACSHHGVNGRLSTRLHVRTPKHFGSRCTSSAGAVLDSCYSTCKSVTWYYYVGKSNVNVVLLCIPVYIYLWCSSDFCGRYINNCTSYSTYSNGRIS